MTYHSSFNDEQKTDTICGIAFVPIKTKTNGKLRLLNDSSFLGPAIKASND